MINKYLTKGDLKEVHAPWLGVHARPRKRNKMYWREETNEKSVATTEFSEMAELKWEVLDNNHIRPRNIKRHYSHKLSRRTNQKASERYSKCYYK